MKKIKISLFCLIFIVITMYCSNVFAASANLSLSSNSVNVGDEFNVSINLSDISVATLTTRISIDTSKVQYISGPANSNFSNGRVIYSWTDNTGGQNPLTGGTIATFTFKAISSGNATFGISGEFFSSDEEAINVSYSGASISIVEPTPPTEEETEPQATEMPPVVNEEPTIRDEDQQSNNNDDNDNNDNSNITQEQKSSNANLKSLQLDIVGISPAFNKNTTSYWITVPTSVNSIDVIAEPEDENATVTIQGNENLKNGKNYIYIRVTAENRSSVKTYTINVTKDDDAEASDANLESLAIEGVTLVPEFNRDITEYTVDLKEDIDKLNILAFPSNESATVRVEGNEKLENGENTIKIIVTSQNEESEKVYTIKVNKNVEPKEEISTEESKDQNSSNQKSNNIVNIIIVTVLVILIIIVVVMIIRKYKNKQ